MTNKTISALTAATTPLAGTELVPIWDGATKKVSVANLTAGRPVATGNLTTTGTSTVISPKTSSGGEFVGMPVIYDATAGTAGVGGVLVFMGDTNGAGAKQFGAIGAVKNNATNTDFAGDVVIYSRVGGGSLTERVRVLTGGDVEITTGNITPKVAAKGINFTANTPAAGMTSQLLNWYEEGTWTPTQGAGLTVVGAFSSSGTYTRIGRQVTVRGTVTGATSIACSAIGVITSNLPFTSALNNPGIYINDALAAFGGVDALNTSVYAIGAITVCGSIYFTVTYNV